MTGRDNARFIARLYDKGVGDVLVFVDDLAELGRQIDIAVRNYSAGMKVRLAFALTLAVDFEFFRIDEVLSVGDQRFHGKYRDALFVKQKHCSILLISHDTSIVREFCQKSVILKAGRGRLFKDIDMVLKIYQTL